MELFVVKNSSNKIVADKLDSKTQAKAIRDEMGGAEKGFRVSRGKDNKKSPNNRMSRNMVQRNSRKAK